ncbi:GNAT family N-acetyltransferase [Clostridium tunisiense]|uniref:GNAT family N-acetyltransferase n=1 Tax=Clostridium tunisiense TaxID=219748 RepID=UPI00030BBBAA|nr:GNAT family N-acetyltransferase [Clostridium tunisiense]
MIIKTTYGKPIYDFLNKNKIINLNLIGFLENVPDAEVYVDNEVNPTGVVARKDYFSSLYTENDDFLNEVLDTLYKEDGFYGFRAVHRPIAEKIRSKFLVNWESLNALYYYPNKEVDLSRIKNQVRPIDIKDAEIINHYYTYKDEISLDKIKDDIENRPSSAIYVDGDIASWVLIHNDNSMGIMYTKEEYRGRDYAEQVTLDLTNKILKSGHVPFLTIVDGNSMSPGLAKKCGFIHEGVYTDWFGIISGTPKVFIEWHDECDKKFQEATKALREDLPAITEESHCLYILNGNESGSIEISEDFKTEVADTMEKKHIWCTTLAEGLDINVDRRSEFLEKLMEIVSNEDYEFRLILGTINGKPVSTAAFLRLYDDLCGIYLVSTTEKAHKDEFVGVTLTQALKKVKEHDMYLCFVNSVESELELYNKVGFICCDYRKNNKL